MKFSIDIDCTPEEARVFLGLPDVEPMQIALVAELEKKLRAGLEQMDAETIMRTWLPAGIQGIEQLQKMFWGQMTGAQNNDNAGKPGDDD